MLNVINYYNENYLEQAIQILIKENKVLERKENTIFYTLNEPVKFATINGKSLHILKDLLGFEKGTYIMPFDILCKYKHKGNVMHTVAYLIKEFHPDKIPFVRVGADYFRIKTYKDENGNAISDKLIPFLKAEIKEDFGKDAINYIQKYDEFCIKPNNLDYKRVVDGNLNNYHKVYHTAIPYDIEKEPEKIQWSMTLMNHIFGDQLDLGIKYMKVLWEHPMQILPILTLASEERQTGKTTFANWLELIYGENLVSIGVSDMKSNFNAHISEKLIIVIEETVSESHSLVNKLKMISTAKKMLVNKKNITQYSVDFYGKVLILTNEVDKFLKVDDKETRFWVRRIPVIKTENHNIEADLKKEIGHFLYFLQQQPEVDRSRSRMVFTPQELGTDALKVVKNESKTALEKDIVLFLDDYCLKHVDIEEINFISIDIKRKFFNSDNKINVSRINRTLKEMKLKRNGKNGKYYSIVDENYSIKTGNGNYFTYKNKHWNGEHQPDDNEVPF